MVAREENYDDVYNFPDVRFHTTTRRRGSPPIGAIGMQTSANLKKRSTKAFQKESRDSARSFLKTLRFVRFFFIIGTIITLLVNWEQTIRTYPVVLADLPGLVQEVTKEKSDLVETQVMLRLRRVRKAHLDVPRNPLKPTTYTPPNPALAIPRNLDTLLADIDKPLSPSDVPFFWHILKSGGTTIKDAAGMCLGKVEASESGVLDGHRADQALQKVHISGGSIDYVNGKEEIRLLLIEFQVLVFMLTNIIIFYSVQLTQQHHKVFKELFPWVLSKVPCQMPYFLLFFTNLLNFSTIQVIRVEPFAFSDIQLSVQ